MWPKSAGQTRPDPDKTSIFNPIASNDAPKQKYYSAILLLLSSVYIHLTSDKEKEKLLYIFSSSFISIHSTFSCFLGVEHSPRPDSVFRLVFTLPLITLAVRFIPINFQCNLSLFSQQLSISLWLAGHEAIPPLKT